MITFDRTELRREIGELEQSMAAPGFWEQRETATATARRLEQRRGLLTRLESAETELAEIRLLYQMASEADDEKELSSLAQRAATLF